MDASEKLNALIYNEQVSDNQKDDLMNANVLPVNDAIEVLESKERELLNSYRNIEKRISEMRAMSIGTWVIVRDGIHAEEITLKELDEIIKR